MRALCLAETWAKIPGVKYGGLVNGSGGGGGDQTESSAVWVIVIWVDTSRLRNYALISASCCLPLVCRD